MFTTKRTGLNAAGFLMVILFIVGFVKACTEEAKAQNVKLTEGDTVVLIDDDKDVDCYDGDTCTFEGLAEKISEEMEPSVRLARMDAPEMDGPCREVAVRAMWEAQQILSYRPLRLIFVERGRYDRWVVEAEIGNLSVSDYLIMRELATRWPIREPSTLCQ